MGLINQLNQQSQMYEGLCWNGWQRKQATITITTAPTVKTRTAAFFSQDLLGGERGEALDVYDI